IGRYSVETRPVFGDAILVHDHGRSNGGRNDGIKPDPRHGDQYEIYSKFEEKFDGPHHGNLNAKRPENKSCFGAFYQIDLA
ncbi:MAG: hypothetical protein ABJ360_13105, partial [Roseobacter sp.]